MATAGFNNQIGNEMQNRFVTIDVPSMNRVLDYRSIIESYKNGDKISFIALQHKCTDAAISVIVKRYAPHLMRGRGRRSAQLNNIDKI